jgi:O-antigen/teichoic acid export membrane protein
MNILIAHYWGAKARGEVASITVISTIAASTGGLGMHDILVWAQSKGVVMSDRNGWARFSLLTVASTALVGAAASYLIPGWSLFLAIMTAALTVATQYVRLQAGWFLSESKFASFDATRIGTFAMALLTLLILARFAPSTHPAIGLLAGQVVVGTVIFGIGAAMRPLGPVMAPTFAAIRNGLFSSAGGLLYTSLARSDVLIVAILVSQSAAGVYAVALAAAEAVLVAANGLAFHALRAGGSEESVWRLLRKSILITLPLLAAVYVLLRLLTPSVLGLQFAGIEFIFVLLAPGTLGIALVRITWAESVGKGSMGLPAAAALAGLIGQTGLDLVFVPRFGSIAAAVVSSVTYSCLALFAVLSRAAWSR